MIDWEMVLTKIIYGCTLAVYGIILILLTFVAIWFGVGWMFR